MKLLVKVMTIVAVAYVLLGAMSCTTYTCPTFAKVEITTCEDI